MDRIMPRLLLFPALKRVTLGLLVDFWRTQYGWAESAHGGDPWLAPLVGLARLVITLGHRAALRTTSEQK
jgi:hypothetical protein